MHHSIKITKSLTVSASINQQKAFKINSTFSLDKNSKCYL